MEKTRSQMMNDCMKFFERLAEILKLEYEVIGSCNQDVSMYLIPKGTEALITYYSKPDMSFRISDHWNWRANLKKCDNPRYIQCLNVDLPWAKSRPEEGKASKPIFGCQVAMIGDDGKYHHVYGERFDRKTKKWTWVENNPETIAESILNKEAA